MSIGRRAALVGLGAAPWLPRRGAAQGAIPAWPQRSVRIIVPFPPGGPTDLLARFVGQKLSEELRQSFVVDNRPGAGGNIGSAEVARAEPDGHTLLVSAPGNFAINQFMFATMPYNPARDLTGVALLGQVPIVLVVHPSVPAHSVVELIAYAKARPGQLNFASGGIGTSGHLSSELFRAMAGLELVHVPYNGSAPARADVVAGRAHLALDNLPVYRSDIREGLVRVLGTGTPQRTRFLPDLPTLDEAGVPGYAAAAWYAMAAPAATPPAVVRLINQHVNRALVAPDVARRIETLGADTTIATPEEVDRFIAAEARKWQQVVEVSGVRAG